MRKIRQWLNLSNLAEGERVPAEKLLAEELEVSRSDLRKALLVLETEGQLDRHVGRGTFIRDPSRPGLSDSARLEVLAQQTGPHEAMIARLALEPEFARLAAIHATQRQILGLRKLAKDMPKMTDWSTYEDLDSRFPDLIAEATGNLLLHEILGVVNSVRWIDVVRWARAMQ